MHTDKRPENTKDPAERGRRISLTFRHIDTFLISLSPSLSRPAGQEQAQVQQLISGHSATGKTRTEARPVVQGGEEAVRLLAAFGAESHQSELGKGLQRGVRCAALYYQHSRVGVIELL